MSTWLWVVIVVAVIAIAIGILSTAIRRRRSEILRTGFGPEYDRTVERTGDRAAAEADLRDRQRRHDELELRPLEPRAREGFIEAWQGAQAEFVDSPEDAITDADLLIQTVMRDRGYPIEEFEERVAIISVDHPDVAERYRRAHDIAVANARGAVDTESLRRAMQDYGALFDELVEETAAAKDTADASRA